MEDKQSYIIDFNKNMYLKYYSSLNLSSNSQLENTKFIILMSNGEKQISSEKPPLIKNSDDIELSPIGIQQALDIGNQLALNLFGINFSEINIFTSPFTATIQTSLNTTNGYDEKPRNAKRRPRINT